MNTIIILIVTALCWLWWDNGKKRELALSICQSICKNHNLQLLDHSVAINKLSLMWLSYGPCIKRTYSFDLSEDHINRKCGSLVMLGAELIAFRLP